MLDGDLGPMASRWGVWWRAIVIWAALVAACLWYAGCDWQEQVEEEVDRGVEQCEVQIRKAIALAKADAIDGCWTMVSEILIPAINYAIDAQTKTLAGVWADLCYAQPEPAAAPAGGWY